MASRHLSVRRILTHRKLLGQGYDGAAPFMVTNWSANQDEEGACSSCPPQLLLQTAAHALYINRLQLMPFTSTAPATDYSSCPLHPLHLPQTAAHALYIHRLQLMPFTSTAPATDRSSCPLYPHTTAHALCIHYFCHRPQLMPFVSTTSATDCRSCPYIHCSSTGCHSPLHPLLLPQTAACFHSSCYALGTIRSMFGAMTNLWKLF